MGYSQTTFIYLFLKNDLATGLTTLNIEFNRDFVIPEFDSIK